jgi:hypothetical protein
VAPVIVPSMPAEIRQLLDLPNTLTPRPRNRRVDAEGRRLPAGPAPPSSWLKMPRHAAKRRSRQGETTDRTFCEVDSLPGISPFPLKSSLMATCLRYLATNWGVQQDYNGNYLATLPSRVRSLLLSYIAVHGPPEGVGYAGLKSILRPNDEASEDFAGNDDFDRLDLSGSIGRSIFFKQLRELIIPPQTEVEDSESWDTAPHTLPPSINAPIHALRILSLANPPGNISWPKLLSFVPSIPTLTHLSLANWPTPKLTPNATTDVMSSPYSRDLDYGDTNYYSHSLDCDYSEATSILRRLSSALYSLEYLDLNGCQDWASALRFHHPYCPGIDWVSHWGKIRHISLRSGIDLDLSDSTGYSDDAPDDVRQKKLYELIKVKRNVLIALKIEKFIRRRRGWIEVLHDEWPWIESEGFSLSGLEGEGEEQEQGRNWRLEMMGLGRGMSLGLMGNGGLAGSFWAE